MINQSPSTGVPFSEEGRRDTHGTHEVGAHSGGLAWVPACWALVTVVSLAWALFDPVGLHAAFGGLASLIVCLPLLRSRYQLHSPWTPLAAAVSLAAGVRGIVTSLGLDLRLSLDYLWLLGRPPEFFVGPYVIYVAGVGVMTFSYLAFHHSARDRQVHSTKTELTSGRFTLPVLLLLAGLGFSAFLMFAQETDGLSLSSLSRKRTTIGGVNLAEDYESFGHLRWLNGMSALAFWFAIAYFRTARGNIHGAATRWVVLTALFLNAIALPVYASSRSELAYVIIVAILVAALTRPLRLRWRFVAIVGVSLILMLATMTFLRATLQSQAYDRFSTDAILVSATEGTIYDRTFGDMATSAQIIGRVPEQLEYQQGATIARWLVAPIPRAVWPEKPLIQPGPIIGQTIYGTERSGVPPGLIAEMYWNFGILGVLTGAVLFGYLISWIENRFPLRSLRADPLLAVTYAVVFFRFGLFAFSIGLGSGLFRMASDLILVTFVSLVISGRVAMRPPRFPPHQTEPK